MLCKTSEDIYEIIKAINNTPVSGTISMTSGYTQYIRDDFTYTASTSDTYKYKIEFTDYINVDNNCWQIEIYKNDTKTAEIRTNPPLNGTIDLSNGDVFKIKYQALSSIRIFKFTRSVVTISALMNKYSSTPISGKPRELETIGNKARTTIFWIHIDGTRITHE